jgi:hypothetical protein
LNAVFSGTVPPWSYDAQNGCSVVLRNDAWLGLEYEKRFPHGNLSAQADTNLRSPAKKEAVSGSFSEQDGSASGFSWIAREPELMYGAEGRASSQRSVEYHIPTPFTSVSARGSSGYSGLLLN